MGAVRWFEDGIRLEEVDVPELVEPTDAIVRVTHAAICGTDLHAAHGKIPGLEEGNVCGHEFAGEVVAVGDALVETEVGDRVVASMFSACGRCPACLRLEHRSCPYLGMFGMGLMFGDLPGGQAEYVRVPFADMTLTTIPDDVSTDDALLLADILPTAWSALEGSQVRIGDTVAVIGAGPLGQLVAMCAPLLGAGQVIAIDLDSARLDQVKALGALPVNPDDGDPVDAVYDVTNNQGADLVIEAVGNAGALKTAFEVARMAGSVTLVGSLIDEEFPLTAGEVFVRGLTIRPVLGDPLRHSDRLLRLIQAGRLTPSSVLSHHLPLREAVRGYELFESREATKVVLTIP